MSPCLKITHPREIKHQHIKLLMRKGQLVEAMTTAHETLMTLGHHVGLLCDLAACQYELGLYQNCQNTAFQIQDELKKCSENLSPDSIRRTGLFAAKLFEEMALPEESLRILRETKSRLTNQMEKQIFEIQELRILSYFGKSAEIAEMYARNSSQLSTDIDKVEFWHSIMWTDWALFGLNQAISKWNELQKIELNELDQRLVARDFLEMALLSRDTNHQAVNEAASVLKSLSKLSYDEALLEIYQNQKMKQDYSFSADLSSMQKLRLLILAAKYSENAQEKSELKRKFNFLCSQLAKESLKRFQDLVWQFESNEIVILKINFLRQTLELQNQQFKLTKTQTDLLKLFAKQTSISNSEATEKLWSESYNESHYDRLRMNVYKLNKLLRTELGFELLKVSKSEISLHPQASLT